MSAGFLICFSVNNGNSKTDSSDFQASLVSLYAKYDTKLTEEQKKHEYGLKRLIVTDYNNKNYGEIDKVIDEKHNFALLQFDSEQAAKAACALMKQDGMTVDADGIGTLSSYSNRGTTFPLGSNTLGTPQFMNKFAMSKESIIVATIDTGVMLSHPDLKYRFYNQGYDYSSDGFENADYDPNMQGTYYSHGSFVSGVIADNTLNNVKLLPYKVVAFGASSFVSSSVISAINDAVDRGVSVISISLSTYAAASSFKTAIRNAVNNGVCICVAAGNEGKEVKSMYPACAPGSIVVSALDKDCADFASFSNYGEEIDFAAPGARVISTIPSADGPAYAQKSGTSFSAPYIAAICANIKSVNKSLTRDQVYNIICEFAHDYGDPGFDNYFGNGVPDLSNIVYTDGEYYRYAVPEGVLDIYKSKNYTKTTQPWKTIASKIITVNIDNTVKSIGNYEFYNMASASFNMPQSLNRIGEYAFWGCKNLPGYTFTKNVEHIGVGAFKNISDDFVISGYRNTVAESYTESEGINFNILGCKHNYIMNIVDPEGDNEGYTEYTCTVCGDYYIGEYIEPTLIDSGLCGENITYELYDTGKLVLDGTGAMYDYSHRTPTWDQYKDDVKLITISSGIEEISPFAFYGCTDVYEFRCDSDSYKVINGSLYSPDEKTLILAVGEGNTYVMPEHVENFTACAFSMYNNLHIQFNSRYHVVSSVVYDEDENIVMALPSFRSTSLVINDDINVYDYAFLLPDSLESVRVNSMNVNFGQFCFGYDFNGDVITNPLLVIGFADSTAQDYALEHGFDFKALNSGKCGNNIDWYYDLATETLTLSGSGEMYYWEDISEVEWFEYLPDMKEIVIDDDITYLSDYAFYNAASLTSLTMPLSIDAPANETTWFGCSNIANLTLTHGSGQMSDYGYNNSDSLIYTYTPWYISRRSIRNFSLDENVASIGDYAFRNCTAIKSITLNCCEYIGENAFLACSSLNEFTNYCKTTRISNHALFSYKLGNAYYYYSSPVMTAYYDSTTKDYCQARSVTFNSLGCGHSRGYRFEDELPNCCYDTTVHYHCVDCDDLLYAEFVRHVEKGHYVKGELKNKQSSPIADVDVYVDGELAAVTNSKGIFVISNIICGNHTVEFKKNGITFSASQIDVDRKNVLGNENVVYGNYVNDNAINGKDYAYARRHGIDTSLFNYGWAENTELDFDQTFVKQAVPNSQMTCTPTPGSDYKIDFVAVIDFTGDYMVEECGFIYGKNMSEEMLTLENVNAYNSQGLQVKKYVTGSNVTAKTAKHTLIYGSTAKNGTLSARFYIKYSNGVYSFVKYSDVSSYTY